VHVKGILQVSAWQGFFFPPRSFHDQEEEVANKSTPNRWPVIAGIVIGSLIILSVVICVARCICCGAECVCCCFKCCSGCCGSGRRDKGHQQLGSVPPTPYGGGYGGGGGGLPFHNQQYRSAPAPVYQNNNMGGGNSYAQTATFEGKVHEDSLPAMPSWENAQERRVEVMEDAKPNAVGAGESHELEKLSPAGQATSPSAMAGFAAPAQPQRAMGGSAPHSPYGGERDPFLQGGQTSGVMHADGHSGYRGTSPQPQGVGYGYANHRPGGLQNSQPSYNSSYQDSQSDFYAANGYGDQRPNDHDREYSSQSRPGYSNRQYSEQTLPAYEDNRGYASRQDDGYGQQQQDARYGQQSGYARQQNDLAPQYTGSTAYDPRAQGHDDTPGAYRAFSPAYGASRGQNGSWKDV
jgi:hypothetical protein